MRKSVAISTLGEKGNAEGSACTTLCGVSSTTVWKPAGTAWPIDGVKFFKRGATVWAHQMFIGGHACVPQLSSLMQ